MKIIKTLKFITEEFIYGCHLLSLGAAAIIITAAISLNQTIDWIYPFIIYLIAYLSYLYNRYKEINEDILSSPERSYHLKKYHPFVPLIIVSIFLIIFLILLLSNRIFSFIYILFMLSGGMLYTVFLKKITKKITAFKNFFVALEWTLPVVFLPLFYSFRLSYGFLIIIVFIFIRTFIANSFFDIKDLEPDKKNGLLTLPLVLGVKNFFRLLFLLLFASCLLLIVGVYLNFLPYYSLGLILILPYNFFYLINAITKKIPASKLYFVAGGEFVLWPIAILFFKALI
jgi:4-hydroxybenzoate polyprenyltransferase